MLAMMTRTGRNRWLIALLLLITALAAGGAVLFAKRGSQVAAVPTMIVERGAITAIVSATGTISPVNSVEIASRVTGLITEVKVAENDMVKAGQVLVVLDDSVLKEQLAQFAAQLDNYAAVYERSKKLTAIGGQSAQQLDSDRTNYLVAQSTYNNYMSQLQHYIIKAPIDGMVVGKPTPAGQTVAQGIASPQVIMTIADMSQMQIKVMVDETDVGKVKAGQKVSFMVDAYPDQVFAGKVAAISRSAVTSSNVIYYPVYVDVEGGHELLYPTMTARVSITVGERENVLVVPQSAVKEDKGKKYVKVLVGEEQRDTAVTLGLAGDDKVEVLTGLGEGAAIVLPGAKSRTAANNQNMGPPPPM